MTFMIIVGLGELIHGAVGPIWRPNSIRPGRAALVVGGGSEASAAKPASEQPRRTGRRNQLAPDRLFVIVWLTRFLCPSSPSAIVRPDLGRSSPAPVAGPIRRTVSQTSGRKTNDVRPLQMGCERA